VGSTPTCSERFLRQHCVSSVGVGGKEKTFILVDHSDPVIMEDLNPARQQETAILAIIHLLEVHLHPWFVCDLRRIEFTVPGAMDRSFKFDRIAVIRRPNPAFLPKPARFLMERQRTPACLRRKRRGYR
jgi:hypothetical protein